MERPRVPSLRRRQGRRLHLISLLLVALILILALVRASAAGTSSVTVEITPERLDRFIEYATSYLVRISHTAEQDPQHPGHFTYIAYLGEELQLDGFDEEPQTAYNLLRHNGAIYSLALAYERRSSNNNNDNEQIKEAMLRGIHFLKTAAMGPVPDVQAGEDGKLLPDILAPWETKKFGDTQENPRKVAKLGGAGLGLIALCNVERIVPGTTDLTYMRQIGNFIQFMQNEDGSFTSKFDSKDGKDTSWTSLYYPGEAALGLVYLFELETDDDYRRKWLDVATATLLYLERLRRTEPLNKIEPDHWALLASTRLLPNLDVASVEYWLVYNHAVRVVQSMLAHHTVEELAENNGCFSFDRRTCPTATRLEGLLAALSFVKDYEMYIDEEGHTVLPLRERMMRDINLGIDFMLQSQQQTDENNMQGAVPFKFPMKYESDMEVRVDYVQHSMSAVIAYEAAVFKDKPSVLFAAGAMMNVVKWLVAFFLLAAVILLILPSAKKKSRRYNE